MTTHNVPACISRFATPVVLLLLCGMVVGCGSELRQQPLAAKDVADGAVLSAFKSPLRFFSPNGIWDKPMRVHAKIDPHSAALVGRLDEGIAAEEQAGGGPGINTTRYSVPVYTVPVNQPTVRVELENPSASPALQAAWDAVPLPATAQPAAGTDHVLVVWQPSTDRLWEFWRLVNGPNGWQARWGGAIQHVSSNPGVYGPNAWPGAKSSWGSSASSLSITGGLITLEDLEQGEINHAISVAIPDVRSGFYVSPAQRTDGKSPDPLSLPEGTRLRLDPKLDLAALHLPRLTLMIAEAAQRYGIIVRDTASHVTFFAQDPVPTGTEPYTGEHGYFEGKTPSQLLASFPWRHLQILRSRLHRAGLRRAA